MGDWTVYQKIIHAICGFLFGFFATMAGWLFSGPHDSFLTGLVIASVVGLVVAAIAAVYLDKFWTNLRDHSWWNWWT
jgi:hypothetical protein